MTGTISADVEAVYQAVAEIKPEEKFRKDYAELPYEVSSVDLEFDVRSESLTVVNSKMHFVPKTNNPSPLELDGEDVKLVSLKVNGDFWEDYETSKVGLRIPKPPFGEFDLETVVEINPKKNTQLSGLYASSGNLCTQCEAEGFRRITYFYDRPDCMTKYKVRVEANKEKYPILLSNGNEIGKGDTKDDDEVRHWKIFEDPFKKPSYLFALVAGDLGHIHDTFTTKSGRTVDLYVWSEHHNVAALDWSMHALKTSMKWDEDTFGREYDLDVYHIVAVDDFNMGAMENKGLNVFNTACVLAKPTTATDNDYERVLGVVAHEYFHNVTSSVAKSIFQFPRLIFLFSDLVCVVRSRSSSFLSRQFYFFDILFFYFLDFFFSPRSGPGTA